MKNLGPVIVVGFLLSQLIHAYYFFEVIGPKLVDKYGAIAYVYNLGGWFLFYKVCYLYLRVHRTPPGSPQDVPKIK